MFSIDPVAESIEELSGAAAPPVGLEEPQPGPPVGLEESDPGPPVGLEEVHPNTC